MKRIIEELTCGIIEAAALLCLLASLTLLAYGLLG
jgi:hypothetical protein